MRTQTFGIEIETTGLGRQRTAEVIAKFFGTTAQYIGAHLDDWKIPMPDGRRWTIESDGSVTDPSAEVVSPVCCWEDIEMVQEVVRALRKAGAKVDNTCGIQIHIDLGAHTPRTLRNLVNIVNAKEELLTQALGISYSRRERWCKPVEPAFLEALNRKKPSTMDAFAELWYKHSGGSSYDWRRCAGRHYDGSRYHLLNLHATFSTERPARTIEFRAFNATLHAGEIKSYIQLCLAISAQALHSKSASSTRPETDNPKYTFRCWLLRLGFIGEEFETARLHLTKRLPGNAAWRHAAWARLMVGWTATSPKRRPASREANASKYTKEDSTMKNTSFRTFTIPRANGCAPFKFAVHTLANSTVQVKRISPYDETEYHRASKLPGRNHWHIIQNGRTVSTVGSFIGGKPDEVTEPLSPEQIAYFLIEADMKAHLESHICRN